VVRDFGLYAAVGVLSNVVLLLAFLPGMLAFPHRWATRKSSSVSVSDATRDAALSPVSPTRSLLAWDRLRRMQVRFGTAISALAVAVMIGLGWGTTQLEASVRIETLFADENQLITDYRWIEENVGATVPIEAVVHFDPRASLRALDRVRILREVEQSLIATSSVRAVTSCLGFLPPESQEIDESMAPLILDQIKPRLNDVAYFAQDEGGEHWRLTAYLSAIEPIHYGDVLRELRDSFAQIETVRQHGSDVRVEVSGLMPLVHAIQAQLLRDLSSSFVTAFLLISLVMTIAEAGILAGVVSMIPNVFPSVTLFGMLGWLGWSIDIGSIMTASMAMGIAVDDTLHFLSVFRHHVDRGQSRDQAVLAAYGECGRAMIQTTLICASGMAIFALSDFMPTARFAWMMVALLSMALVGDLIVLPALLLSPAGRLFEMSRSAVEESTPVRRAVAQGPHLPEIDNRATPTTVRA
jgi:predicted RND superfamily exporter protein